MGRPPLLPFFAITLFAILLLAGTALAEGERYEGAGAVIDEPPGMSIHEGWTGNLYQLDVRREDLDADETVPFVRLAVVPRANLDPEVLADRLLTTTMQALAPERHREIYRSGEEFAIAGRQVSARCFASGPSGKADLRLLAFGLGNDGQAVAVIVKIRLGDEEEDLTRARALLENLELRKIGKDSLRQVRVAGARFRVPLVAREKWEPLSDGSAVGRFTLPEGQLTVHLRDLGNVERADRSVAQVHEQNHESVKVQTANSGVEILAETMTAIPAGDDLMIGSVHRIRIAGEKVRDSVMFALQDGTRLLGFSFLCEAENREALSSRMVQVLGSVKRSAPRHRPPNELLGGGIRLRFGSRPRLAFRADAPGIVSIDLDLVGPLRSPVLRLLTRPADGAETPEAFHTRSLLARAAPAEGREETSVPVRVFGDAHTLRVTRWPGRNGHRFLATLLAPFGERQLLVTILGDDAARHDLLQALDSLLQRLSTAGPEAAIDAGSFAVTPGPLGRVAFTDGSRNDRTVEIAGDGLGARLRWYRVFLEDRGTRVGAELDWIFRAFRGDKENRDLTEFEEIGRKREEVSGHPAATGRLGYTTPDGRKGVLRALAVWVNAGFLQVGVDVRDREDPALAEAAAGIIGSLRFPD